MPAAMDWNSHFASRGSKIVRFVYRGCLRRRICGAEFRGLLVLFAIRSESGNTRRDFLLCECLIGHFGAAGIASGGEIRAHSDDDVNPPTVEYSAAPGPADAHFEACVLGI